ncbi:MAG: radical SAM protein [Clostridia bacterium]|nr:radical SAM protein [Clostridia bacterium]
MNNDLCSICPRGCRADRDKCTGFCGVGSRIRIARAALHFWEEPCISGTRGSGAVFFCGCNLKCVFCQNIEISRGRAGAEVSPRRLGEIFLELQRQGAHNINLVTPTHYVKEIREALLCTDDALEIPIVYNCGGYELPRGLEILSDRVNIYLMDFKYASDRLAERYSRCSDYFDIALAALKYMIDAVGAPVYDNDGIMQGGVIVRHLVLPSCRHDSIELLRRLAAELGTDKFRLSLMSQFTPNGDLENFPELNRRVTSFEYKSVVEEAVRLGFSDAYIQERSSAKAEYTPPFDLMGVIGDN